jgi:galactofuranose transport system permease protein
VLIELDAIAAVVVGGTALAGGRARVIGTVIGALLLQLVTAAMIMNNVSFQYSLLVKALIILVAVYLQRSWAR